MRWWNWAQHIATCFQSPCSLLGFSLIACLDAELDLESRVLHLPSIPISTHPLPPPPNTRGCYLCLWMTLVTEIKQRSGAGVVLQRVKPLLWNATNPHWNAGLSPKPLHFCFQSSYPIKLLGKQRGWRKSLEQTIPVHPPGWDLEGAPDSRPFPGPTLSFLTTWKVIQ